ncbi:MAG: large repetitive protein, partial [Verrucomicrobiota bacterium]
VASVNDPPVTVPDSAATDEDTRLAIPLEHLLTNDSDVDGDTLTVAEVSGAEHGTVAIVGGAAVFDPAPNYNGRASFAYRVVDGAGGSATARVSIEVRPVNDAPTCAPVTFSIDEDTTGSAAPDCVDVDGDTLTYTVGSPFVLEDGRLVARPGHDENGVVTATYRASDGAGGTATAPVTVTVRPVNDVPVATDSSVSLDEDAPPVPIDLGALVSDAETADAGLTYQIVSGPTKGTLSGAGPTVRYDSNDNANGADAFTYRVVDRGDPDGCSAASARCDTPAASEVRTVRIAIAPVNDPPTVRLVGGAPIDEGGARTDLTAVGADVDGDTLTYAWTTDVGTVSATGAKATLTADDGPATATVRVSVSDGNGGAATVTKTIEIRNVAPTANAGADQTVAWGMPVTFSGTANDVSKADRAAGLSPRWWFGDGASATGATAQHAYAAPGPYTATFAGTDKDGGAASDTADVTVTKRATTLAFAGAVSSTYGETVLAAKLRDSVDGGTAQLAGRSITFTIGGATYTASTDATGLATVAPAPLVLGGPLGVSFAGDGLYTAAAAAVTLTVDVPFGGGGAFVVEGATPLGAAVTFWGSKWAKANGLDVASSFKGFVRSPVGASGQC